MKRLTLVVIAVVIAIVGAVILINIIVDRPIVKVVHWSNGHLVRPSLMMDMATQFNKEVHRTRSGSPIVVVVYNHGSAEQSDDLTSRVVRGVPLESEVLDPTIVTPSSADWLVRVNQAAGREVIDIGNSRSIVQALIGIVTYRDMAEVLGWPEKEIGYADIIALRNDPKGWASYPDAKAEWGQRPLFAFTDPVTSTTGRSALFSLYAIAAGKAPEELTLSDVRDDPEVIAYVKQFQTLIDHYMIGTIPLNTKVYQGPKYGHFFLMPEDNLIHLYEGTERALINGVAVQAPAIAKNSMVMIYPKEGSMIRNNIAGIVKAPWVTAEQQEAADIWIDYLLSDKQQRAFMNSGFRPGSKLSLTDASSKIKGEYGLEVNPQTKLLSPELIDPAVALAIEQSWEDVKRPAIVTFVIDTSASMSGTKLEEAKKGLVRCLDSMAKNNQVGFLTVSATVYNQVPVAPLAENKYKIANVVQNMNVGTNTALYDGIKAGIEMTDAASSGPAGAIRAVVVLTDGLANQGQTRLDDLLKMISRNEVPIEQFRGFEGDFGWEKGGRSVPREDIIGSGLEIKTNNPIQIFFIGIGKDADIQVGRILAQATGAEYQGVTESDLANLLEEFSKYF